MTAACLGSLALKDFVHLHLHSQYSLLSGAIRLKSLFPRLQELGMKAVACTDLGNMFGAVDFYKRAKAAGIKPILGVEVFVAEGSLDQPAEDDRSAFHLVLLARNDAGYANLCKLVSFAYTRGLRHDKPRVDLAMLAAHREGLIATSACADGQIAQAILQDRPDHARQLAIAYRDTFEAGCFYLEVIPSGTADQQRVNAAFRALGAELAIEVDPVVTSQEHLAALAGLGFNRLIG